MAMAMVRARAAASWLLLLVLLHMRIGASSSQLECKLEYTSLALLSCQETTPTTPTPSCCDALLYSLDIWPVNQREKGLCCLCVYVLARQPSFDLATTYITCRGSYAASVAQWTQQLIRGVPPHDCYEPCSVDTGDHPPPLPSGKKNKTRRKKQKQQLGVGVIIAIVVCSLAAAGLLGYCLYHIFFSPAAKARRSPDPSSNNSSASSRQRRA
uniref:Bifunctional inhibitor/plant lipid transfer protein/seed storage helical domain-containing protein n=1 Tax=Oryza nivara TaxID=4536 RepID=A0A0E0GNT0_ORYNI